MIFTKFTPKFWGNLASLRRFSQIAPKEFHLDYEDGGKIAILSLNRPKQKNAFSVNLVKDINESIYEVTVEKPPRVAILRSLVPGVFCAGADLKERATMSHDDVSRFVTNLRSMLNRIYELPFPVIAAVDGLALGGGLEIALACDLRVGSTDCKIGLVETRLGIIPGAGGTQYLPRLIATPIAKELIYTARILDAQTAGNYGIFNHIVEQNETRNAAYLKSLEIAREILPNGPVAVRMAKMAINKGLEVDLSTGLTIENGCYGQLIHTEDRLEGLQAFQEKRKPNYTGR